MGGALVGVVGRGAVGRGIWVDPASPGHKPLFADEGKEFILFCGAGWRSVLAAKSLQDMGMRNVAHIDGGYAEWLKQGGSTETLEDRQKRKAKQA